MEKTEETLPDGTETTSYSMPAFGLSREEAWLGIASVDAFFSWTEHVSIQIAILQGKLKTGEEVANLAMAMAEWADKVKWPSDWMTLG